MEREKLRLDMCPSCSARLRSSPGAHGQTLTVPWERAGAGPSVAQPALFYGFHSRMGFSLSLQAALVAQSSKTSAKHLRGCGRVPGRKVWWRVFLRSPDSSRISFVCCSKHWAWEEIFRDVGVTIPSKSCRSSAPRS